MSSRQRIPRPRHLFPEVCAFLIQGRRANLHGSQAVRRAIGRIPVWLAGSLAGVAGIMLTVCLFFIREQPSAQAGPALPAPVIVFDPLPPLIPSPGSGRRLLEARLDRMQLPFGWDQERIVAIHSGPPGGLGSLIRSPTDLWHPATRPPFRQFPFSSYLDRAPVLTTQASVFLAAEALPAVDAPASSRTLGVIVEKTSPSGAPGAPLTYDILIRNPTIFDIEHLRVYERISHLHRVSGTEPAASLLGDELAWDVTRLGPGESVLLRITLLPEMGGVIETETRVAPLGRVGAGAAVRAPAPTLREVLPVQPAKAETTVTEAPGHPDLRLAWTPVPELKQGEILSMIFSVSNVGQAPAEDVQLYVRLSGQFEHRYGDFVKHQMTRLDPGQTRRALLQATARDFGTGKLDALLTLQGAEQTAKELEVPIRRGAGQLSAAGPAVVE